MAISEKNKRVIITMPRYLHEQLTLEANKENRSISNYIVTVLKKNIGLTEEEQKKGEYGS